jgi:hypothetical protein
MQPATRPTDFPIKKPSTTAGKRAAELHKDWCDQYDRANQVEVDYVAAQRELEETFARLYETLSKRELGDATDADAKAAEDAHAAAKAEAEAPWHERARAAVNAAETKRHEYEAHIDENLDELVPELEPDAQVAVDTMRKAAQAMVDGAAAWQESRQRAANLIRPATAINGQAIPLLTSSADAAVTAATRMIESSDGLDMPLPARRALDQRRIDLGLKPQGTYRWGDGSPAPALAGSSNAGAEAGDH